MRILCFHKVFVPPGTKRTFIEEKLVSKHFSRVSSPKTLKACKHKVHNHAYTSSHFNECWCNRGSDELAVNQGLVNVNELPIVGVGEVV